MKHDWFRYADGCPRLVRHRFYWCKRCGEMFDSLKGFELIDATECPQPELVGMEELTPG